jgi:hypothetical protein
MGVVFGIGEKNWKWLRSGENPGTPTNSQKISGVNNVSAGRVG